jgi:hypothetical protein
MTTLQNGIGFAFNMEIVSRLWSPIELNFAEVLTGMGDNDLCG